MTKASLQRTTTVALLSATLFYSTAGFATIVYDNSTTDLNRSYFPGNGIEFGDEVFLSGGDRTITDFRFETFFASNSNGTDPTGQLVLRLNDGQALSPGRNAPGTEIFRGTFDLKAGRGTVVASGLNIAIPGGVDHFTWGVSMNGVDAGEQFGLMLYNPPAVGTSFDDFWQATTDPIPWNTFLIDGGATPANFAARITAVPEPSTAALSALGAVALFAYFGLRRRAS
jgi:hypothetical protein